MKVIDKDKPSVPGYDEHYQNSLKTGPPFFSKSEEPISDEMLLGLELRRSKRVSVKQKYHPEKLEYAIREVIKVNKDKYYIPLVRTKTLLRWANWGEIVLCESKYHVQSVIEGNDLTWDQAVERIEGYKKQIEERDGNLVDQEILYSM